MNERPDCTRRPLCIAIVWEPSQADHLAEARKPDTIVFPISQKSYAAARNHGLNLTSIPFWRALDRLNLDELDARADAELAQALDRGDPRAHFDRPAIWHSAREAGYLAYATRTAIEIFKPDFIGIDGNTSTTNVSAISEACASAGVELVRHPYAQPSALANSSTPAPLTAEKRQAPFRPTSDWILLIAIAVSDLGWVLSELVRERRSIVMLVDERYSGDSQAVSALAQRLGGITILRVQDEVSNSYSELDDNSKYAHEFRVLLQRLCQNAPSEIVLSDLCRTETAEALKFARKSGISTRMLAHGGAPMVGPYRFTQSERDGVKVLVWTASAARNYGGTSVISSPRRLRPGLLKRWARLGLRALSLRPGSIRIGVVVTTDSLFSAPECALAPLFESFRRLVEGAAQIGATFKVRLRRLEDHPDIWSDFVPLGAPVEFEHSDGRPFVAFARDCDLLVELGSESTAFLEAAANGVPYVRVGAPRSARLRFNRDANLVPRLEALDPWRTLRDLAISPLRRTILALHQFRWVQQETKSN